MKKVYMRLVVLILLVLVISGIAISSTADINTLENLMLFKPWSVGLAIVCLMIGLVLDGTRLMHMVRISDEKISLKQAVQVVFGNYFLALLGPGAAAGAVAQMLFLKHAGISSGKAAVLVLVRTLVSIFFLSCCLPFVFLVDDGIFPGVPNALMMFLSLVACGVLIFIMWAAQGDMADYLAIRTARRLSRRRGRFFLRMYRDSKIAIRLLTTCPLSMLRVFIESGVSLIFIYMVVPCLMLGLNAQIEWITVMGRMMFLNILLYFSPTPGGAGIAEGGFVYLFGTSVPEGMVGVLAVSWRIIAEYLPFVIGMYYTITVFGKEILKKELSEEKTTTDIKIVGSSALLAGATGLEDKVGAVGKDLERKLKGERK